jgi:hypothetical protein
MVACLFWWSIRGLGNGSKAESHHPGWILSGEECLLRFY